MKIRRLVVVVFVAMVAFLWASIGASEVFEIQPYQHGMVRIDEEGLPAGMDSSQGVGDSSQAAYVRSLYSFDLSFLPPGSVVASAVIHSHISAVYGDPSSLGRLFVTRVVGTYGMPSVDLQSGWGLLSLYNELEEVTGAVEQGSDVWADLTSQFQGIFPPNQYSQDPGRAIVRFQFEEENNGSNIDDFLYLYRTWLEIDVQFPDPIAERPIGRHLKHCLPVVASLPGAGGTQWVTELHLTARHDGSVWLYFTETGNDGTESFEVRRIDLDMWQTVRYQDVLPDLFGLEGTKGWIEVFTTDPEVVVNARVANVGGEGSYGQTIPLVDEPRMLRLQELRFWDKYQRLLNLVMFDKDNRVNVGAVNLGPGNVTLRITAIPSEGAFLGEYLLELGPFEHRQIDRLETVIPEVDGAGLVALSFALDGDSGNMLYQQGVAIYASRVDNTTGDAVFILP